MLYPLNVHLSGLIELRRITSIFLCVLEAGDVGTKTLNKNKIDKENTHIQWSY